jgi:hypothetical protein
MRDSYFLIIAVLIYIMPALVYSVGSLVSEALSPNARVWGFGWLLILLFYLLSFLPFSPYLFSLLLYPYGIIFGVSYYAISYGLLYRYWKRHVASVERAELSSKSQGKKFGKWLSLLFGLIVIAVSYMAGTFVSYGRAYYDVWYVFMIIIPAVAFLSFGILMRRRIVIKYYFLSVLLFAIWFLVELIIGLLSIGGAP